MGLLADHSNTFFALLEQWKLEEKNEYLKKIILVALLMQFRMMVFSSEILER